MIDPEFTDEGKATITHVARRDLPWRRAALTECGLDLAKHAAISAEELKERVKKLGQQRTAMLTCMTCWQTSYRWVAENEYGEVVRPWLGSNVLTALEREIQWARRHREGSPLMADLKAIEVLIQRHRPEFDELLEDQRETVSLADERKARKNPGPRTRHGKW
jgi:hypothetical protein